MLTSTSKIGENLELHSFSKFKDTKAAISEATKLGESSVGKALKKLLKKKVVGSDETLAVVDKNLAAVIKKKFDIEVQTGPVVLEIVRGVKTALSELIEGFSEKDAKAMQLSLSHGLSRFKLQFSPEKVDVMIIQAVGLLDDLDRELNNFGMRLKEWYGWHFPELAKIVSENAVFAKVVRAIGFRTNTKHCDLSECVPDDLEVEVKQAAEVSMGTEIGQDDLNKIFDLADTVLELTEYRASLADYLKFRMEAIAPNLTYVVGELVGARLVAHAGSLVNLAKFPSSTVQILGAEKALFRALKTKKNTPKYGLIYHATLVGQSVPKLKGKISRTLAAKLSLACRVDALADSNDVTVGMECRAFVERKLEQLSDQAARDQTTSFAKPDMQKYQPKRARDGADESAKKRVKA